MGKKSPPATTSQNVTTSQVVDPDLKKALLGNLNMSQLLTSGMLPRMGTPGQPPSLGPQGSAGATSPMVQGYTGGMMLNSDGLPIGNFSGVENGAPVVDPANPANFINADGTPWVPPSSFTAGFDPSQTGAQNELLKIGGEQWTPEMLGSELYDKIKGFQAPNMEAAQTGPTSHGEAGRFTDLNLDNYISPLSKQIIDPLKGYFNEMGDRAVASKLSMGNVGSAVRGSNDSVREGLIRGEIALQSAPALSGAYSHLADSASGLAVGDLNRLADMSRFNAGSDNTMSVANAGFRQEAGARNNANAMAIPGIQMAGQDALNRSRVDARGMNIDNQSLIDQVGAQRRGLAQSRLEDPFKALQLQMSATGATAPSFTGSASTQTGTSPYARTSPLTGALGGAAGAAGLAGMTGMFGTAGGAGVAAAAASPWLWPLLGGGALLGALS